MVLPFFRFSRRRRRIPVSPRLCPAPAAKYASLLPSKANLPMQRLSTLALSAAFVVAACSGGSQPSQAQSGDGADTAALDTSGDQPATPLADAPFTVQDVARFAEPWAKTGRASGRERVCQYV